MAALEWGPPGFGGGVVGRLINAGGVPLLLSYTPCLYHCWIGPTDPYLGTPLIMLYKVRYKVE